MAIFREYGCSKIKSHERGFRIYQSNGRIELFIDDFLVPELSSLPLGYCSQVFLDPLNVDWWQNYLLLGKFIDYPDIFDSLLHLAKSAFFERSKLWVIQLFYVFLHNPSRRSQFFSSLFLLLNLNGFYLRFRPFGQRMGALAEYRGVKCYLVASGNGRCFGHRLSHCSKNIIL